jgi:hypothetical protein
MNKQEFNFVLGVLLIITMALVLGDAASNRNEYQEYLLRR